MTDARGQNGNLLPDAQRLTKLARPGLTGWAQVNGRNAITWEEKFKLDVWYVDHFSLWVDLRIILLTLLKVVRRRCRNLWAHAKTQRRKEIDLAALRL